MIAMRKVTTSEMVRDFDEMKQAQTTISVDKRQWHVRGRPKWVQNNSWSIISQTTMCSMWLATQMQLVKWTMQFVLDINLVLTGSARNGYCSAVSHPQPAQKGYQKHAFNNKDLCTHVLHFTIYIIRVESVSIFNALWPLWFWQVVARITGIPERPTLGQHSFQRCFMRLLPTLCFWGQQLQ